MTIVTAYHRPTNLEEALNLLNRGATASVIIAGGTHAVPQLGKEPVEVIDLQAAGLDELEIGDNRLVLGAMVRLEAVVENAEVPQLLRELAHREGPNTFRHAATIGGVIAGADWESELLAGLLVYEARVTLESASGSAELSLSEFFADRSAHLKGGILSRVAVAIGGEAASARVARTPADRAILSAAARRDPDGQVRLALSGVAEAPILVDPDHLEDGITPPGDFRGASDYRKRMAAILGRRAIRRLDQE